MDAARHPPRSPRARWAQGVVLVAMAMILSSCTTGSRSTLDTFRLVVHKPTRATPERVAANRFPQVQVHTPDIDALAVLGYVDGGRQQWYAGSHAIFELDAQGLLIGSSGLGRQLQARIVGPSPFTHLQQVNAPVTVQRRYDWVPAYQLDVAVTGTLTRHGTETIKILGRPQVLVRFEERLQGGGMRGTNVYWADARTGFIWKSRQFLAPGHAVDLLQLKPYQTAKD
ncbi:YjbF family lipoprotein [Stenotrophomonas sp. 24(2023)]|uniref:YjbF family lipoprotein n=1 Tax=Stenotrophomonas sp. 24(2023) TaxID=3068324 RepID=UPI0027E09BB5|nr:YjbF family lipoprotein [Stenotrophomonas sp. 24(2023)]WMJ68977.1 YjbF family lipoprotein [Stenotrophomonas sp. 24(2023)]